MAEREMTVKQRKWLKLYVELGNATEAAMQVYDCKGRESACAIGVENLRNLRGRYGEIMEAAGIDDAMLASVLKGGLKATKVSRAQHEGEFGDVATDDDWMTRHRYLDTAHKLRGDHAPVKQEITTPDAPIRFIFREAVPPEGEPDGSTDSG